MRDKKYVEHKQKWEISKWGARGRSGKAFQTALQFRMEETAIWILVLFIRLLSWNNLSFQPIVISVYLFVCMPVSLGVCMPVSVTVRAFHGYWHACCKLEGPNLIRPKFVAGLVIEEDSHCCQMGSFHPDLFTTLFILGSQVLLLKCQEYFEFRLLGHFSYIRLHGSMFFTIWTYVGFKLGSKNLVTFDS